MATAPGDIIRVVAGYTYLTGGLPISNVLHYKDVGPGGATDPVLLAGMGTVIEGALGTLVAQQSAKLFFTTYDVFNVTQGLIIGTAAWPTLTNGAQAGELSASQVVGLLRMITPKSRVQGRINIVGVSELILSDGQLTAPFLAAAATVGASLLGTAIVGPTTVQYTVYNRVLLTDTLPTSTAIGVMCRSLTKRKRP